MFILMSCNFLGMCSFHLHFQIFYKSCIEFINVAALIVMSSFLFLVLDSAFFIFLVSLEVFQLHQSLQRISFWLFWFSVVCLFSTFYLSLLFLLPSTFLLSILLLFLHSNFIRWLLSWSIIAFIIAIFICIP